MDTRMEQDRPRSVWPACRFTNRIALNLGATGTAILQAASTLCQCQGSWPAALWPGRSVWRQ
jgi:hypothetical protein